MTWQFLSLAYRMDPKIVQASTDDPKILPIEGKRSVRIGHQARRYTFVPILANEVLVQGRFLSTG